MKTGISFLVAFLLMVSISLSAHKVIDDQKSFIGTYLGLTEDFEYKFQDEKGNEIIFSEINEEVEIDLYNEENYNKKYRVTWVQNTVEELDDEGEPTGTSYTVNMIVAIEEVE